MINSDNTPVQIKTFQEYFNLMIVRLLVKYGTHSCEDIQRVIHLELLSNLSEQDQESKISIDAKKFLILLEQLDFLS